MLTRSANPLGKLIDYLQEDMDSMLRELDMWNMERRKNENALNAEGRYFLHYITHLLYLSNPHKH